jgi:hypothetical protein
MENKQKKNGLRAWLMVVCLPSKHKAFSSNLSTNKKQKPKQKEKIRIDHFNFYSLCPAKFLQIKMNKKLML